MVIHLDCSDTYRLLSRIRTPYQYVLNKTVSEDVCAYCRGVD